MTESATKIYGSELHRYMEEWLEAKNVTWFSVTQGAGLPQGLPGRIRAGQGVMPATLRRLAEYIRVPVRTLYIKADLMDESELEPAQGLEIDDPVISQFFTGGNGWDNLPDDAKDFIRQAISLAQQLSDKSATG
jgi:hypothetical protein